MALQLGDRIAETTTTSGTGTIDLAGALAGYQAFVDGVGNNNETYYCIVAPNGQWEVGRGVVTVGTFPTPNRLSRLEVFEGSSGDGVLVNFAAGTKEVFCTLPASKFVVANSSGGYSFTNHVTFTPDATYDIGAPATSRPRNLYLAGILNVSGESTFGNIVHVSGVGNREIRFETNGSRRWAIQGANSASESGSNAGSNFALAAYADNGSSVIDVPISIMRIAGGAMTVTRPLTLNQGTDATTVLSVGVGGSAPTANRTAEVFINSPHSGTWVGHPRVRFYRTGTRVWDIGSGPSMGGASSANDDFYFAKADGIAAAALSQTGRLRLSGGLDFTTDNAVDIGSPATNRPRSVYVGSNVIAGGRIDSSLQYDLQNVKVLGISGSYNAVYNRDGDIAIMVRSNGNYYAAPSHTFRAIGGSTDADVTMAVGEGGTSPTVNRTMQVLLQAPSGGSFVGNARLVFSRGGTSIWMTGIDSTTSGAKSSSADYFWSAGSTNVAALTSAAVFRLGASDNPSLDLVSSTATTGKAWRLQSEGATGDLVLSNISGGGGTRWRVKADGRLFAHADNVYDVGSASANRPRNIYVASDVVVSGNNYVGGQYYIAGAAGTARGLFFRTGATANTGTSRAAIYLTNDAETGADAGSNLWISMYADNGAAIDSPVRITRAAGGTISLLRPLSVGGHLTFAVDNNADIGAQGATRPRTIYAGTGLRVGDDTVGSFTIPAGIPQAWVSKSTAGAAGEASLGLMVFDGTYNTRAKFFVAYDGTGAAGTTWGFASAWSSTGGPFVVRNVGGELQLGTTGGLTANGSGHVLGSAGSDTSTTVTIGSAHAAPIASRVTTLTLDVPHGPGLNGGVQIIFRRGGAIAGQIGYSGSASGAKTSVDDFHWFNGSAFVAAMSSAGKLRLSGGLDFTTDNTVDIGMSAGNRPRTAYVGTSVVIGTDPGSGGALRVGGNARLSGEFTLDGLLTFPTSLSLGAPTFTTRSAGTRIVVFPAVTGTTADYAIGMESSHMWFSVTTTSAGFKFYGATTQLAYIGTTLKMYANNNALRFGWNNTSDHTLRESGLAGDPDNAIYNGIKMYRSDGIMEFRTHANGFEWKNGSTLVLKLDAAGLLSSSTVQTGSSGTTAGVQTTISHAPTANGSAQVQGVSGTVITSGSFASTSFIEGVFAAAKLTGGGANAYNQVHGVRSRAYTENLTASVARLALFGSDHWTSHSTTGANIADVMGLVLPAFTLTGTAAASTFTGVYITAQSAAFSVAKYGLWIGNITGGVSGNYAMYADGGQSHHRGPLAVGSVAVGTSVMFRVSGGATPAMTGVTNYGAFIDPIFPVTATTEQTALFARGNTTSSASPYTIATAYNLRLFGFTLGTNSAITTAYGLRIEDINQGGTNYAIYTNAGLVRFGDAVTIATGDLTLTSGAVFATNVVASSDMQVGTDPGGTDKLRVGGNVTAATIYRLTTAAAYTTVVASMQRTTASGLVLTGSTGSSYDFAIATPAGGAVMEVPTGTNNAFFQGQVSAAFYRISGSTVLDRSGNYTRILDSAGSVVMQGGNATDPTNYYENTSHSFRERGGLTVFGILDSAGLNIGTRTFVGGSFKAGTGMVRTGTQTSVSSAMATTIHTAASLTTVLIVRGTDSGAGAVFVDMVAFTDGPSAVHHVLAAGTVRGAPAARTYSVAAGGVLRLQMASGTYDVKTFPMSIEN